jgi:hypothetical protein
LKFKTYIKQDDENDVVTITGNAEGKLYMQHQVQDYALRGTEFEEMGFLSFTVETYERRMTSESEEENEDGKKEYGSGRPTNLHSQYLDDHPKKETHHRVARSDHHNSLPNIVGPWFPRRDGEESTKAYYYAAMLGLLKPWRDLRRLKFESESWEFAFTMFVKDASQQDKDVIAGSQYFYESKNVAANRINDEESDFNVVEQHDEEDYNEEEVEDENGNGTLGSVSRI